MVIYFSGTGNSRYAAQKIAELIGDTAVSMNTLIKEKSDEPVIADGRLIIATPTYAWRIPKICEKWLRSVNISGTSRVWFVMTCGSEIGDADKYNSRLSKDIGLEHMGTLQVVMPENYLAMFTVPDEEKCIGIIAAADKVIKAGAGMIDAEEAFPDRKSNLYDRMMSDIINPLFYKYAVKADRFTCTESCISCGLCQKLCPTNCVKLTDGKPQWNSGCTHCMACISHCPVEAIEYGRKSKGQRRYHID